MDEDVVFEVESVLGGTIVMRDVVWEDVRLRKHRDLNGRLADVQITVSDPDEVRRSTKRPNVFLVLPCAWCASVRVCGRSFGVVATYLRYQRV